MSDTRDFHFTDYQPYDFANRRHIGPSPAEMTEMLGVVGFPSLDALIDVIAAIELDVQVSGDAALAALPTTRRVGTKPFAVEGLNDNTGEWETPVAGRRYHAFQAGVQLANRVGPLNEIEFSEYVIKAQNFADSIGGAPEFPDMLEEVARARELDQFASAHDAQLSFTVCATSAAWSPGYIHQHAARWGFVAGVIPGNEFTSMTKTSTFPSRNILTKASIRAYPSTFNTFAVCSRTFFTSAEILLFSIGSELYRAGVIF